MHSLATLWGLRLSLWQLSDPERRSIKIYRMVGRKCLEPTSEHPSNRAPSAELKGKCLLQQADRRTRHKGDPIACVRGKTGQDVECCNLLHVDLERPRGAGPTPVPPHSVDGIALVKHVGCPPCPVTSGRQSNPVEARNAEKGNQMIAENLHICGADREEASRNVDQCSMTCNTSGSWTRTCSKQAK